jgi:hypothetical protein
MARVRCNKVVKFEKIRFGSRTKADFTFPHVFAAFVLRE